MARLIDQIPDAIQSRIPGLRQGLDLAIAGAIGAVFGLFLYVELIDSKSVVARDAFAGLLIGGSIGYFLNAIGPFRERAWLKLARAANWGALTGAVGGAIGLVIGEWVIGVFQGGLMGRAVSWSVLGLGIGLSQGIATWSRAKLIYGLIGGAIGGAIGGFLFEALRLAFGNRYDLSQGLGIVILGAGLGGTLSLVEQVLRRAWVEVLSGRQEGSSYLLSKSVNAIGLDERAEVGLFGDAMIARRHAEIVRKGDGFVVRNHAGEGLTVVNDKAVTLEQPLNDGDQLRIGHTRLIFRKR